jgi:hypothetical protein
MNFKELAATLHNGFHDAALRRRDMDYVHRRLRLELYLGLAMVYGDLDAEARTFRFTGPTEPDLEKLSGSLGVSLTALIIVEGCLRTMDLFAEPLWKLNREVAFEREIP